MSSLQDKMYNHEVNPPLNTWDRIAAALDESETENRFPSKLYNTEVNPPADVWDKIANTLDAEKEYAFPDKLYNLEVDPPAGTWNKIDSSLHTPAEVERLAPVRRLLHPFFRYAAAALFIGAVAYGITRMTVNNNRDENNTAVTTIKDSNNSAKKTPADTKPTEAITVPQVDDELVKSSNLIARVDRKKTNRRIATSAFVSHAVDDITIDANLSQSLYAYADHVPDIADNYVMLMTPNGNIIRMSKKWSNLLCCVSGEDQDADCKDQLKKWQEKMAASSLAPSPANFMDILSLVNSLDESNGL